MRFFFFLCFLLLAMTCIGQLHGIDTRTRLENQRKEILKDIKATENELSLLKKNENITLEQLNILQVKEKERQALINNIYEELHDLDKTMATYAKEIEVLKKKLMKYKLLYSQSIRYTYKSQNAYNLIAFLFSSADFNDAFRRLQFLQTVRTVRKMQADAIRGTHAELYKKIDLLNADRDSKNQLLADQKAQEASLLQEKEETKKAISEIEKKAGALQVVLDKKKKAEERINEAIKAIIITEMRRYEPKKNEKNNEENMANGGNNTNTSRLKPDDIDIAHQFTKLKGNLAWPVERGNISCHFGKYCIKKIDYFNNGVDIQTIGFGVVYAVFEGTVTNVLEMDGKVIVLLQHGNYFTVYNNLLKAKVGKGEHVKTRQQIGIVANNDEGLPTLNFQIWKSGMNNKDETVMMNPESWLKEE